jgi:hypothetical protein
VDGAQPTRDSCSKQRRMAIIESICNLFTMVGGVLSCFSAQTRLSGSDDKLGVRGQDDRVAESCFLIILA